MEEQKFCIVFNNGYKNIVLVIKKETTIQELINQYFEKMEKANLVDENIEKTYFTYNCKSINYKDNKETVGTFFNNNYLIAINVCRFDYNKNYRDYTITRTIKDNVYTCVDEARVRDPPRE